MIRNLENRIIKKIHNRCDRGSLCVFFRMERERRKAVEKEGFYKYTELKSQVPAILRLLLNRLKLYHKRTVLPDSPFAYLFRFITRDVLQKE